MELLNGNRLREGYTTGSCAAAAAKAAAQWLTEGIAPEFSEIMTPSGRVLSLEVVPIEPGFCGIVKDSGDDPDATNGMTVRARVVLGESEGEITLAAGEGVGTVTLPGLKAAPGEPAINPVPRQMILTAVREIIGKRSAMVTISVPGGEERAKKTFNPRLGVTGGISILGTSGIVRPMNEQSIFDSLTLELNTHAAQGRKILAVSFGNTGEESLRKAYAIEGRCVMQSGNYIGYLLDEAVRMQFKRILLCGHPGKLLKVAAGTFNTHNRTGDGRKEALCTQAALASVKTEIIKQLYKSSTTEVAMKVIKENGLDFLWNTMAEVTAQRCVDRAFGEIEIATSYIDNNGEILGFSLKAEEFAEELRHEK